MKFAIKRKLARILVNAGICNLTSFLTKKKLKILMFHNPNSDAFEEQIKFLAEKHSPVTLQQVHDFYYRNKPLPDNPVLITFDDGYMNIKTFVEPILYKYGIKAVVFVPTGLIDANAIPWWSLPEYALQNAKCKNIIIEGNTYSIEEYGVSRLLKIYYAILINRDSAVRDEIIQDLLRQTKVRMSSKIPEHYRLISWNDIKKSKMDFGSHTVTHPILTNVNLAEAEQEIKNSKDALEQKLQRKVISFCYPNGNFNPKRVQSVKKAGYKLAFTTEYGVCDIHSNPFTLKRIGINEKDDISIFRLKLSGLLNWFNTWRDSRKKLTVISSINYYYPQLGGLTTTMENLHNELIDNNIHSIIYAYPHFFRKIENAFKNQTARSIVHKLLVVPYILFGLFILTCYRLRLRKVIVHGHSANFCGLFAYLSGFLGAKTVHTFHTDARLRELELSSKTLYKGKSYFNKIDSLTAVSAFLRDQSAKKFNLNQPVRVIYNANIMDDQIQVAKKSKKFDIIWVGNLNKIKDPLTFLDAVKLLKQKKKRLSVLMIGSGDLLEKVREKMRKEELSEILTLKERVNHDSISDFYQKSSVYVCSSIGEGFGNTIIEAVSCGCRVVATRAGGIPEIGIEEYGCGTLVPPKKPSIMAKAIEKELTKKPSPKAKDLLDRFDKERTARQYVHLFQDFYNKNALAVN